MFRSAECIQISKDCVSFYATRIRHFDMVRIGVHTHDLLANFFFCIGQIDAVAKRLAHLRLTVRTRQAAAYFILRDQCGRLYQCLAVYAVEFADDLSCLLDHRQLVFSYRNSRCLESCDIGCLADRVGEKSYRDACLKITHLNLSLNGWVSLQSGNSNQIHIEKGKLCQLWNLRLNKNRTFFRIQSAGKIIQCYLNNILTDLLRIVCIVRQRLCICNHDKNLVVLSGILQLNSAFQRSNIMSYVKSAGRSVAGQNDLFHLYSS